MVVGVVHVWPPWTLYAHGEKYQGCAIDITFYFMAIIPLPSPAFRGTIGPSTENFRVVIWHATRSLAAFLGDWDYHSATGNPVLHPYLGGCKGWFFKTAQVSGTYALIEFAL